MHSYAELVMLFFIMLNVLILIFQSPGNTYGTDFNEAADTLDFICTVVFTIECVGKIVALGLYWESGSTYLKNNWNLLDFIVVVSGWWYIVFVQTDDGLETAPGEASSQTSSAAFGRCGLCGPSSFSRGSRPC
jgi:hypothetical protein